MSIAIAEAATSGQIVVFSLGADEYALPIEQVQEIIRYAQPRSVASDSPSIRGVISLRGKIIPVCDLASHLGSAAGDEPAGGKVVIVEAGDSTAGILVDDVAEVLTVSDSDVEDVPTAGNDAISGIAKVGDRLIVLLDTAGIFGGVDLAVTAAAA
jgi:purine-binding chemotaxis protein CheW